MRGAGPWGAPGRGDTTGPGPVSAEGPVPTFAPRLSPQYSRRDPPAPRGFSSGSSRGEMGRGSPVLRFHPPRSVTGGACGLPWGTEARRSRWSPGRGGGCRKATLGRDPASMGGKEGERCRESFSAEPVRLLLKPQHLNHGNLIRVSRTRLVKDMCCICRVRGLVVSPFGRYLPIFTLAKQIRC